jgi:hypothetical protein
MEIKNLKTWADDTRAILAIVTNLALDATAPRAHRVRSRTNLRKSLGKEIRRLNAQIDALVNNCAHCGKPSGEGAHGPDVCVGAML